MSICGDKIVITLAIESVTEKVDKNAFKDFTKNKVTVYIYTRDKKVYKKVKSAFKAKAPKNLKFKQKKI